MRIIPIIYEKKIPVRLVRYYPYVRGTSRFADT